MSVVSISEFSSGLIFNPIPYTDLQELKNKVIRIRLLSEIKGETHLLRLMYDPTNTSHFEGRICITCGSKSGSGDPDKSVLHNIDCRLSEIVLTLGDRISANYPSRFQGCDPKLVSFIYGLTFAAGLRGVNYAKKDNEYVEDNKNRSLSYLGENMWYKA